MFSVSKLITIILAITFLVLVILGIGYRYTTNVAYQNKQVTGSSAFRITTSFYPLYFFTQQIVGDQAQVYNITPAGAEPHDYEPSPQDVARLQDSQLVIVSGGVEPWLEKVKPDLVDKRIPLATVGESLFKRTYSDEDNHVVPDPHIWLSPVLAQQLVEQITKAITAADPAHAEIYAQRALMLKVKLQQLDTDFRRGLQACEQKSFVTSHTAFGYLAAEYQLEEVGITGLSPDAEPSPRQLAQITDFAKAHQIKYIFFESLVNPELSQTLAQEVGAQTLVLNPLEGLTEQDIERGKDYFSEMQQNLANLRLALTCHTSTATP